MEITKDMLIGDLLKAGNLEAVAEVLYSIGMHCLGCAVLLSLPKRRFSDRRRAFVMSIIAFIALVASFSLKNLPISEKMFVPLSLSIGFCTLLLALQSYKISATYGNPCALFCDLISTIF